MPDFDNTNSGALFENDKGDNPNRPDYKGSINVDGKEYWISAWFKHYGNEPQKPMYSLSVQPKEENTGRNSEAWQSQKKKFQENKESRESEEQDNPVDLDDIPF